ncbi:hypothetical protein [Pseudomonas gessardii]|uniref:Uncharacterized protein n=1 Tax=Pseudomonas gessardii TaxID=78544 RepID=A0A7Y1MPL3_9PSED|nr:hypothetical protein [Pseudomonas gessardii]NNA96074.1 hypothetical protein [Pseudomonas gessardii]
MTPVHLNTRFLPAAPTLQRSDTPPASEGNASLTLVQPPAPAATSHQAQVRGKLGDLDEILRVLHTLNTPNAVVNKSLFLNKDSPLIPANGSTQPGTNRLDNMLAFYAIVPSNPKTSEQVQAAINAVEDARSEIALGLDDASSDVDGLLRKSNDPAIQAWVAEQEAKYKKPLLSQLTEELSPQALKKTQGTPAAVLELILKSPKANERVQQLLGTLGGADFPLDGVITPGVKVKLLLKALTLSLDPLQARKPGEIAGFNLASSAHWGQSYPSIKSAFRQHLVDSSKQFSSDQASLAAYILQPQFPADFAVRDMPADLPYRGSAVWVNFQHGVNLAETIEPGSSRGMGFQQLVDLPGKLSEQAITDNDWALITSTRTQATLEWAVAQGVLAQKESYSPEDINKAATAFDEHSDGVVAATEQMMADVPMRKDYFERMEKGTSRTELLSLISPVFALYRHASGEKITPSDILYQYPVYDEGQFQGAFDKYLADTKLAYGTLIHSQLSQLPLKDREAIERGDVTLYALRTKPGTSETDEEKKAAITRPAFILKAVYENETNYYEMNPVKGIARRRDDLKPILESYNPTDKSYEKDFISIDHTADGAPSEELVVRHTRPDSKVEFKQQWADYRAGKGPKPKSFSIVVPQQLAHFPAASNPSQDAVPHTLASERSVAITKAITTDLFYVDEDTLKKWAESDPARESAAHKNDDAFWERVKGVGQMVIPFWSGIENLIKGDTKQGIKDLITDGLLTFAGPAGKFAAGSVRLVSTAGKIGVRALLPKFAPLVKKFAGSVARNLNPLDPLMPVLSSSGRRVLKYQGEGLKNLQASLGKFKQSAALKLPGRGRYDVTPQIPLTPRPIGQGKTLRVPEGISSDQARVLQRHNHSDVIIGDDVYRYDPKKPESLIKLGGPDDSGLFEGFVLTCGGGGRRLKRDLNDLCYTKQIEPGGTSVFQDAQALEHRRLIPGAGPGKGPRTVIHEHRRYRVNEAGNQELLPMASVEPVTYKPRTSGTLVNEPDFGYDDFGVPRAINQDTVVVKMDAISDMSNDQRVIRGIKINHGGHQYVVVEADTGVHYYAELTGNGQLDFHRMTRNDALDVQFIKQYDQYKDVYGFVAQGLPDNPLVVLPSLESLIKKIVADEPMSPAEITHLASVLQGLSPEKQREVLMGVYAAGNNPGHVVIAAKPIRLAPVKKPADFAQLSAEQQNRVYAQGARKAVDEQFQATGIRSANQQVPGLAGEAARSETATEMVGWLYTRTGAPNYSEMVLKTGAGNCDQMAKVAVDTINASGGSARIAQVKGHTFAIVGGPPGQPRSKGFVGPEWDDAWVVDPWAGITCRAADYPAAFKARMQEWSQSGRRILISDGGTPPRSVWSDPMEPRWISATVDGEAQVFQ